MMNLKFSLIYNLDFLVSPQDKIFFKSITFSVASEILFLFSFDPLFEKKN